MYLGVRAVIAKSIERIHKANLINFCIVPIEFADASDYEKVETGEVLQIDNLLEAIKNADEVRITEVGGKYKFVGRLNLSSRDREILLSAGLLNYTRKKAQRGKGTKGQREGKTR
jgi:aconitate hydratase